MGVVAFWLGLSSLLLGLSLVLTAWLLSLADPSGNVGGSPMAWVLGALLIIPPPLAICGAAVGVIALRQKDQRRLWPILGLVFSAPALLMILVMTVRWGRLL